MSNWYELPSGSLRNLDRCGNISRGHDTRCECEFFIWVDGDYEVFANEAERDRVFEEIKQRCLAGNQCDCEKISFYATPGRTVNMTYPPVPLGTSPKDKGAVVK